MAIVSTYGTTAPESLVMLLSVIGTVLELSATVVTVRAVLTNMRLNVPSVLLSVLAGI